MDLRKTILKEHSKENCLKIVQWVGNNDKRFDRLLHVFYEGDYRLAQRAAWPVSVCVENNPVLVEGKLPALVKELEKEGKHDAVKRNILRIINHVVIPKKLEGVIMQRCFEYLSSNSEPVGIKAFSLHILFKLSKRYPEIVPEIKLLINDQVMHQTAAFKSAAKKFY